MPQLDSSKPPLCSLLEELLKCIIRFASSFPCLSQIHLSVHSDSISLLNGNRPHLGGLLPHPMVSSFFQFISLLSSISHHSLGNLFLGCFLPQWQAPSQPHFLTPPSYLTIKCGWPQSSAVCLVHFSFSHKWSHLNLYLLLTSSYLSLWVAFPALCVSLYKQLILNMVQNQTWFPLNAIPPQNRSPQLKVSPLFTITEAESNLLLFAPLLFLSHSQVTSFPSWKHILNSLYFSLVSTTPWKAPYFPNLPPPSTAIHMLTHTYMRSPHLSLFIPQRFSTTLPL